MRHGNWREQAGGGSHRSASGRIRASRSRQLRFQAGFFDVYVHFLVPKFCLNAFVCSLADAKTLALLRTPYEVLRTYLLCCCGPRRRGPFEYKMSSPTELDLDARDMRITLGSPST